MFASSLASFPWAQTFFPKCAIIACTHFIPLSINNTNSPQFLLSVNLPCELWRSQWAYWPIIWIWLLYSLLIPVSTILCHMVMDIITNPFWMPSLDSEPLFLYFSSASSNNHKPVKVSLENKEPLVSFGPPHFILPSKPPLTFYFHPSHNSIRNSKRFFQKWNHSCVMRLRIRCTFATKKLNCITVGQINK